MLQLNISIQDAKTTLNIKDPVLSVKTTMPQLEMSAGQAKLGIQTPDAIIEIDQTAFYSACGLKSMNEQDQERSQKARSHVLEVIGKTVRDGLSISNGDTTIAQQAKAGIVSQPPGVTLISIPPPKIRITPRAAHVQVQQGNLGIRYQPGTVGGTFSPGTVSLEMLRYPSVRTWVSGSNLDISV